jgi:hypothetical protein
MVTATRQPETSICDRQRHARSCAPAWALLGLKCGEIVRRRPATPANRTGPLRLERQNGDRFVAAVQVMNTAIATNWHVAAAHTKA